MTGAARGIGRDLARTFHEAHADVFMVDFDGEVLAKAAAELGASGIEADVSSTADVETVVGTVVAETGPRRHPRQQRRHPAGQRRVEADRHDWSEVLGVHAGGTFRFTRACVPHFRTQSYGRVINVTSYTGLRGNPGQANYAMAKAGIIGFTKTVAKELAGFGVTVNAISLNAETRMVESIPPAKRAELTAAIPAGRFAAPEEMAAAVAFLASEEAGYLTGVVLPVDGGMSM